jgi:hypothetical protein
MDTKTKDVGFQMTTEIKQLQRRLDEIERQKNEEVLTLVEILANISFFGGTKKVQCKHAKNGQCSFFFLLNEAKGKIPVATNCRIKECGEPASIHCHLELSNITCSFCENYKGQQVKSKPTNIMSTR